METIPKAVAAIILDLDGVITDTRSLHSQAWKKMFDEFLSLHKQHPFSIDDDYELFVDGKPRYDGVRSFLRHRNIQIPEGSISDDPNQQTIYGLGNRKNAYYLELLEQHGPSVFEDSVEALRKWKEQGFELALVTSSRNGKLVLKKAAIEELFTTIVDGKVGEDKKLKGKPAPDFFLEAARLLGRDPQECIMVEDSIVGIQAGRNGNFLRVIGISRAKQGTAPNKLKEAGADLVISSLKEINLFPPLKNSRSLLDYWDEISLRMKGQEIILFFDFDGTLAPIVNDPEDAQIDQEMQQQLKIVAEHFRTAIISGRDRIDVRDRVGIEPIFYAGSHGFDISGPGGFRFEVPEAKSCIPSLDKIENELRDLLCAVPGAIFERKKYAFAIHYRQCSKADANHVINTITKQANQYPELKLTEGKKVIEVRPNLDWGKGRALSKIRNILGVMPQNSLTFYFGDDVTDEDAFNELYSDGVGVRVNDKENASLSTKAHYTLNGPNEVIVFLKRLNQQCGGEGKRWRIGA